MVTIGIFMLGIPLIFTMIGTLMFLKVPINSIRGFLTGVTVFIWVRTAMWLILNGV